MSHFLIKGTVTATSVNSEGNRTRIRIQETIKDKVQTVEVSKYGSVSLSIGQKVEIVGRIRSMQSKAGDFFNTYLEADDVYLAGPMPEQAAMPPLKTAAGLPVSYKQDQSVADNDVPF